MFYNLLNYENNFESRNRTPHLRDILEEIKPDLFLVCELKDENASNYIFNNAILPANSSFKKATFESGQSPDRSLLQMAYYDADKLILEKENILRTTLRDINHYTFRLKTDNSSSNPIFLEVFVTHLKASRGQSNRERRLSSVNEFVNELSRIPADSHVIFAGDFNFYTSNEPGFQLLINQSNPIQIIDPINRLCPPFPNDENDYYDEDYDSTYFWNNPSFSDVHSQSTRSSSLADGAGGGMDDRFDFIMFSKNFTTSTDLYYVNATYKTIGNNGNCYNDNVIDSNCSG